MAVTLPDGSPISSAEAELVNARGSIVKTASITNGQGSFCDFGFGFYSIRVTHEFNLPVEVYGIKLVYGETQHLKVVLNPPGSMGDEVRLGNSCSAYIRFTTRRSDPIAGVKVTQGAAGIQAAEADTFGRVSA